MNVTMESKEAHAEVSNMDGTKGSVIPGGVIGHQSRTLHTCIN